MARLTSSAPCTGRRRPPGNRAAAASAARSAAPWARWRATTALPTRTPTTATAITTTIIRAASTVAAPVSSLTGFGRRDRRRGDEHARQQPGSAADPGHDEAAVAVHLQRRVRRCHRTRRRPGSGVVAARGQPGRFPRGVDAADLSETAVTPADRHSTSTATSAAMANAASTVLKPPSPATRWCSARG